jgi:hypothetical protein
MKNNPRKQKAKRRKVKPDDLMGRVDSLPTVNSRTEDEVGYDEHGIPESSESDGTVEPPTAGSAAKWPDFAARRKKIFGDRVLPAVDLLIKDRGRY